MYTLLDPEVAAAGWTITGNGCLVNDQRVVATAGRNSLTGTAGAVLLTPKGTLPPPSAPANLQAVSHAATRMEPYNSINLTWENTSTLTRCFRWRHVRVPRKMGAMNTLWALLLFFPAEKTVKLVDLQPVFAYVSNPVAFSPDGKKLLSVSRGSNHGFDYWLADTNGENARLLFETPVDWNDAIAGSFGSSVFSRDGKKVAVLTTKDGKLLRKEKDRLRAACCDLEGQVTKVDAEGDAVSCTFAGQRLTFLDGDARGSTVRPGYKLKVWGGKAAITIHEGTESAVSLVASPDGSRLAFLCNFPAAKEALIRVVELESRKVVESEKFPTRRVSYDGPPLIHWDHDGKGIFHHQVRDQDGKRKSSLACFRIDKKTTETILDREGLALAAVLDQDHLLLSDFDKGVSSILRRSDRESLPLPPGTFVLGGSGRKLVVVRGEDVIPRLVEFQLPLK